MAENKEEKKKEKEKKTRPPEDKYDVPRINKGQRDIKKTDWTTEGKGRGSQKIP